MSSSLTLRSLVLFAVASVVSGFTWPNPRLEAFEALRWDQDGAHGGILGTGVSPCNQLPGRDEATNPGNETNAAQWLRTAFHDIATHDSKTGTGGLDGSLLFELDRRENAGKGFPNTLSFTLFANGRYVSFADTIAAAALMGIEGCGGPQIDFRGGRVTATKADSPGVPEAQDPIKSHTDAFARMGFTKNEMIGLVACGHTIGGVQHAAAPDIVPASAVDPELNPDGNLVFDSSFDVFDNKIATDYVAGRSIDPLVMGPNITTRSDARIFSSDGNVTIKAFAKSPSLFTSTCGKLLSRMLDVVPRGVKLTEVIEPLPVKPTEMSLFLNAATNSFRLSGNVRFWNLHAGSDATVRFLWADDSGKPCRGCSVQLDPYDKQDGKGNVGIAFVGNHTSLWFQLPQPSLSIGPAGVSRFWFEVTEKGKKKIENQNNLGFPLQTDVVWVDSSCVNSTFNGGRIDIAVRKGLNPSMVYLAAPLVAADDSITFGSSTTYPAKLNKTASKQNPSFDIYSLPLITPLVRQHDFNVGATINGRNVTDWTSFAPDGVNFGRC